MRGRSSLAMPLLGLLGPAVFALAGCPDPDGNPHVLWLGPLGPGETRVQLVGTRPPPF